MTRKKVVKKKTEIVFDPKKRKEFLTGFQKRKNERRKRAKDQLERNLKEEKIRIRQEIKDGFKHMKKSFEPLRELTEEDKVNEEEEYEDDDVKVKIVELSTNDWARQNNLLGENRAADSEEEEDNKPTEEQATDDEQENTNCIPGMDFDVTAKRRKRTAVQDDNAEETEENESAGVKHKKPKDEAALEVKSKKELDRLKKTKTLKKLKKSKAFKMKERLDKTANQKKIKRNQNNTFRSLPKNQKKNMKFEPSRYNKGRMLNKKTFRKKQQSRG